MTDPTGTVPPQTEEPRTEAGRRLWAALEDLGMLHASNGTAGTLILAIEAQAATGLDVERLALAINECCILHGPSGSQLDSLTQCAPAIAAEYDRLATPKADGWEVPIDPLRLGLFLILLLLIILSALR